jgi:acyl transferase domain-containing protein
MVGTHTAAQGLLKNGGCALAGGVNFMLAESTTAAALTAGMLTGDGHCKTLDASADGYVRAETCVMMLLDATGSFGGGMAILLAGSFVNQVNAKPAKCVVQM